LRQTISLCNQRLPRIVPSQSFGLGGNFGALPADAEQFMLIEHLSGEFEKLLKNIEDGNAPFDRQQALTLDFYRQRIEALEQKVEILKDKVAQIKFGNGAAH